MALSFVFRLSKPCACSMAVSAVVVVVACGSHCFFGCSALRNDCASSAQVGTAPLWLSVSFLTRTMSLPFSLDCCFFCWHSSAARGFSVLEQRFHLSAHEEGYEEQVYDSEGQEHAVYYGVPSG